VLGTQHLQRQEKDRGASEFLKWPGLRHYEGAAQAAGRERYGRAGDDDDPIYRNGDEPRTVKTTSGAMELKRPRIGAVAELG
jgi:hypothetical protein